MEQKTEASQAVKFRKKPVEIEAIQWTGANLVSIIEFTDGRKPDNRHDFAAMKWDEYAELVKHDGLKIFTLEGKMNADVGDWIIKGVKGEFYPCKPDIFELTYERAALKAQPAPTEAAQGGPIHTINGTFDSPLAYIDYLHNELATLAAQGEDSARLSIPVSAYLWLMGAGGDAFAQPLQAGAFWWRDTFNNLAGLDMMEVIRQDRARASAETGGVSRADLAKLLSDANPGDVT